MMPTFGRKTVLAIVGCAILGALFVGVPDKPAHGCTNCAHVARLP